MNAWAIDGIKETYERTKIHFDAIYFESQTYLEGKQEVLKGLEQGIFYRHEDGSIWVDLSGIGLDKKVLLRADGTSLYLTQDLGTAIARHNDWPFDSMIYVVGSEQNYHFTVLFHVLEKLGYEWASQLHHLSYGMINLPEGKMKSREGTVVDADDILDRLHELAEEEITSKNREADVGDLHKTCEKIALAALHYYLLQVTPERDMIFNPSESISFNGNTGPYLQYMGARISSILRKYGKDPADLLSGLDGEKLCLDAEWDLVKLVADFGERVKKAGENLDPSEIASYLYELSKSFSKYYHDNPILHNEDEDLVAARLLLAAAIRQVLMNAFSLIGVPFLDVM
jgi:arginyl-tRNA synthetase